MNKVIFVLLIVLIFSFSFAFAKDFSDVAKDHWAYEYISKLSDQKIINGYEDGTYRPNGTVTRAEFIKLIVCTNSMRVKNYDYLDIIGTTYDNWYDKYVYIAQDVLTFGYSVDFNKPISRIEMARIVKDFAAADGKKYDEDQQLKAFNDLDTLSEQDKEVVDVVRKLGVISGYDDNTFKPFKNMSRAEVSAVITRYISVKKG